jgi:hypothetical protein
MTVVTHKMMEEIIFEDLDQIGDDENEPCEFQSSAEDVLKISVLVYEHMANFVFDNTPEGDFREHLALSAMLNHFCSAVNIGLDGEKFFISFLTYLANEIEALPQETIRKMILVLSEEE